MGWGSVNPQIVFDVTADPTQLQPAYWFYALFLVIGVGLLVIAKLILRRGHRHGHFMLAFSILWLAFTAVLTLIDVQDTYRIRALVRHRAYTTVEGCLDYFDPGDPGGARGGNERWSVRGVEFDYGQGEVRRGYHLVEPRGGAVHPDTRVRVSFVKSESNDRREIIKLAVKQHACPFAPDLQT